MSAPNPDRRNDVITDRRAFPRVAVDTGEIKQGRRRGRPRKRDDEKLVPVTVYIRPSRYDEFDREAKDADTDISKLLREKIDPPISLQEKRKPA